jgi:hypothetical protein
LVEDKEDKVTNNNNKINIFIVPAERQNPFLTRRGSRKDGVTHSLFLDFPLFS